MPPEAIANPAVTGSDVRDVASLIEQQGLLEQSLPVNDEPPVEQAPEEAQATPEPEETPERGLAPESKGEQSEEVESTTTEADPEPQEELPDTLEGLAEAVGLTADEFADHVHVSVTVNGETRMVTLAEARKGYQLEADYRHKTADLAEQKRVHETHQTQAVQAWQQRFESLDGLTGQLQKAVQEDTGNLESILNEKGSEAFLAAKLKVDQKKELLGHAKAEREKAALETREAQRLQTETYLREQNNLLVQALPEIADAEKGPKLKASLRTYLQERGFSGQEMGQLVDHRQVLVVRDAMRYRNLQKAKPSTVKKLKGLPKVVKPGAKPEKSDIARSKSVANLQRLKKSGSREDAALTIEGIL
jgi:hypothetical protein